MTSKLKANQIKTILIDHLLEKIDFNSILATEVPSLSGKRWADILVVGDDFIHAYEIKSDFDSLDRLQDQTCDSLATFDFTSVVVSRRYEQKVFKKIPQSAGILKVDSNTRSITLSRPAKQTKRLRKLNLSCFLWRNDLIKMLRTFTKENYQNCEAHLLREMLIKKATINQLKQVAIEALKGRYKDRFKNFMKERGKNTHTEDLSILTLTDDEI